MSERSDLIKRIEELLESDNQFLDFPDSSKRDTFEEIVKELREREEGEGSNGSGSEAP